MSRSKSVLDTDMLSEVLKGINSSVVTRATNYLATFGRFTITALTVLEVVKGLHKQRQHQKLKKILKLLNDLEVLPLDLRSAELAGRIYADLERTGQPIGRIDPMIAAIALNQEYTLVTGNTAHYQRIQALGYKLLLDDWRR